MPVTFYTYWTYNSRCSSSRTSSSRIDTFDVAQIDEIAWYNCSRISTDDHEREFMSLANGVNVSCIGPSTREW